MLLLGSESVVTKSVPNDCVVAGVPAKILSNTSSLKNKDSENK